MRILTTTATVLVCLALAACGGEEQQAGPADPPPQMKEVEAVDQTKVVKKVLIAHEEAVQKGDGKAACARYTKALRTVLVMQLRELEGSPRDCEELVAEWGPLTTKRTFSNVEVDGKKATAVAADSVAESKETIELLRIDGEWLISKAPDLSPAPETGNGPTPSKPSSPQAEDHPGTGDSYNGTPGVVPGDPYLEHPNEYQESAPPDPAPAPPSRSLPPVEEGFPPDEFGP